jgi:hypothetical protein
MSDADELTQRYLALWTQYLTTLLADPRAMETLKRWVAFTGQFAYPAPSAAQQGGAPFPAWPPFFGPLGVLSATPPAAETATEIAELRRHVDELERRLAKLERRPAPLRRQRGARTPGR